MNKIAILTDSAGNLSEDISRGIFVVPLYVNIDDRSYKDLAEIKPETLYDSIDKALPQTSAPSVSDYLEKIEKIKALGYEEILGIGPSSELSGTYNAMRLALEAADVKFLALDTEQASLSQGVLILYARDLIEQGHNLEAVYERVYAKRHDACILAVVSDLKYLRRGGRISHLKGMLGELLKLHPILTIDSKGKVGVHKTVRGRRRALEETVKTVKEALKGKDKYYLALAYGQSEDQIDPIKGHLESEIQGAEEFIIRPLTSVLGSHTGPQTYAVCYLEV